MSSIDLADRIAVTESKLGAMAFQLGDYDKRLKRIEKILKKILKTFETNEVMVEQLQLDVDKMRVEMTSSEEDWNK